jgi:hypothetical protein
MSDFTDALIQRFAVTLTQGGADAAIASEIDTGISTAAAFGWLIERVELFLPDLTTIPLATDQEIRLQVHSGPSQGAFLVDTDNDVLCDLKLTMPTVAGSVGNPVIMSPWIYVPPGNRVIVNPTITCRLDTAGTGLTATYIAAIYYTPISISELDLLRMLAI